MEVASPASAAISTTFDYCLLTGKIIALDGLPGAGKTTLGKTLKSHLEESNVKCVFLSEYVNQLLLSLYISDMGKYSFMFQVAMLKEKKMIYERAQELAKDGYLVIIDRSKIGDLSFALMQKDTYNWTKEEYDVYESMFNELNPVDLIVNMDTTECIAFDRKKKRNRSCESAYTIEYYQLLKQTQDSELYMRAIDRMLVIDWNDDLCEISSDCCQQLLHLVASRLSQPSQL